MSAKEIITDALKAVKITQTEAAGIIGMTPKQLSDRMVRGTLRTDDFLNLMSAIGVEVSFHVKDGGAGIRVLKKGVGRHIRMMVDKKIYDTATANAIANSFYADGVNEYDTNGFAKELYVTPKGQYFFAVYSNIKGINDFIAAVEPDVAAEFVKKFGDTD